ncbi:14662_t:CDS:2 [Acaulospora morrowiae]|uniref:14662_t:CDS:1 n=1 Tax=Acaulospora morrowiae TaxID=94023 RepID=A0A9N9N8N5_9GLOM|nr:14662_t:CDS:2 [Acaulospora morrowiae]
MSSKNDYVAVPCEEPKQEAPVYCKELPVNDASASSSYKCCKRRAWKKAILVVLFLFLGGRFLFAGLFYLLFSGCEHRLNSDLNDRYGLVVPKMPNEPACDPTFKWNGPSELLVDPRDVTGLIFNVKGMSAHGSIIIRQDPHAKDYINITNNIFLSEESLQTDVDIKIDIIDEDYTITVEAPSFDGPRPTEKCVIVNTIITLPNHLHFFRSLIADVPNSWVVVEGLGNVDFAYVSLKTRNGHIKAQDLNAAIAEVATINGHVQGSYIVAESLDIRTVNGAIDVDIFANAWSEDISLTTKSMNGHLNISVYDLIETQTLNLKAGSVNGGAVASLPDSYSGDFHVTTLIGYAYVEGSNITYIKNLRNAKIGYKNKKDEDTDVHRKKHNSRDDSHVTLEAVTGSVELYFL